MSVLAAGTEFLGRFPHGCPACQRLVLARQPLVCPLCGAEELEASDAAVDAAKPELIVPFTVDEAAAKMALTAFVKPRWFKTKDLQVDALMDRLTRVWVPHWLVDVDVEGSWEAEAGYDYQVKSSREHFSSGNWQSQEVVETRIRWEPRCGVVAHRVDNASAAGIGIFSALVSRVGAWDHDAAIAGAPPESDALWLPDMRRRAAWATAEGSVRHSIGRVVHQAMGSDHLQEFTLSPNYDQAYWTWLMLPLYTTWYTDDAGKRWVLYVHGQHGSVSGARMASVWRGSVLAGIIVSVAACIAVLGLVLALVAIAFPPLLAVAIGVVVVAAVVGCFAIWPVAGPWRCNARERRRWG
jgi:hypothetical protein